MEQGFFPYFPPLKPKCVLWSSVSYSLKNTVVENYHPTGYHWPLSVRRAGSSGSPSMQSVKCYMGPRNRVWGLEGDFSTRVIREGNQ